MVFAARLKAVLFGFLCVLAAVASATPNPELAARVKELKQSGTLEIQGAKIATGGLIADFYAQRAYTPAFDDNRVGDLMDGIEGMQAHGLNPDDYHHRVLKDLRDRPQPLSPRARANFELLLMDAFLHMASCRAYGKVSPSTLDPNWNFERRLVKSDLLRELRRAMDSVSPVGPVDALLPEPDFYRDLKGALARYRALAASGGSSGIESGPSLKPGTTDRRFGADGVIGLATPRYCAPSTGSSRFRRLIGPQAPRPWRNSRRRAVGSSRWQASRTQTGHNGS